MSINLEEVKKDVEKEIHQAKHEVAVRHLKQLQLIKSGVEKELAEVNAKIAAFMANPEGEISERLNRCEDRVVRNF